MEERRRALVIGATGAQGGSVARHLLARGKFLVRGATRNPASRAALALQNEGAEVVHADLEDIGSLRGALKDCDRVFGVTNFWEHFDKEYQHGKNLVDAVAEAGVRHFVFSSLPSVRKQAKELEVPHFEMKAAIEEQVRSAGIPSTFIHVAFYYDNFLGFFPPRKGTDGAYSFGFPLGNAPLAAVAVEDVGGVVAPIFERPDEFIGRTVVIAGDELPAANYAEAMSHELGAPVIYNHIPRETFAKFGFPGAEDLADMFEFYKSHVPSRTNEINECRSLYPEMQTFERWLANHREGFLAVLAA